MSDRGKKKETKERKRADPVRKTQAYNPIDPNREGLGHKDPGEEAHGNPNAFQAEQDRNERTRAAAKYWQLVDIGRGTLNDRHCCLYAGGANALEYRHSKLKSVKSK